MTRVVAARITRRSPRSTVPVEGVPVHSADSLDSITIIDYPYHN
jgi:hypothetical protein